jgi:hypothetical protein
MFRFFLFIVSVMAANAGMAGDVSPCPGEKVPIQIMASGYGGSGIKRSAAEIPRSLPHFNAFVKAVTEHVAARLSKEKLCITGAKSTDNTGSAEWERRSLFQFVYWSHVMSHDYAAPVMTFSRGRSPSNCLISSPWIDLVVDREPVPSIHGIVYWNERQLLADQAVLAGARNVPPGRAMPLNPSEFGHFMSEYEDAMELSRIRLPRVKSKKPIEPRVPPDILWLLHRSGYGYEPFMGHVSYAMRKATEKGAEGYTKVVLTLIDRCFASNKGGYFHYSSILDVADPVLLKQYKIDTSASR